MIREAVKKHTGVEPAESPPPPTIKAYGQVDLKQSMPLLEALPQLWPGDGIVSRRPLPMEEYGQGWVFIKKLLYKQNDNYPPFKK